MLRKARNEDRDEVIWVESQSTPGLRYVPCVWDMFLGDTTGDWSVAELDGQIVACGKYTRLPDGSAWLETLRVIPERQGQGIGKRFYKHWLALAGCQGVQTMRMYTGAGNAASKGLAERFGLRIAGVYKEARMPCTRISLESAAGFEPVTRPADAIAILMPLRDKWGRFLVMNRTFYEFTPAICEHLAEGGMVYANPGSGSVVALGARFMPEDALHVGVMYGDLRSCLDFAMRTATLRTAKRINIQYSPTALDVQQALTEYGFQTAATDFVVMEANLDSAEQGRD